jgi:hypothetical protein
VMLTLRIPAVLRTALRTAARADHRSVNSLVIALFWRTVGDTLHPQMRDKRRE